MEWNMEENFSMEWNMEENFSMEWNIEWKIFSMKWKWNGRKLPVWNMEKSSSIPYHALAMRFISFFFLFFFLIFVRSSSPEPQNTEI